MNNRSLDFFYFIGSTYTYLSVSRVAEVAARASINIRWRPFNVRALMIEQNNRPFVGKPAKLEYMWRDLERRAAMYGIPYYGIPPYPIDPNDLANRTAIVAAHEGWCPGYTAKIYRTWFRDKIDPGDEFVIRRVLGELGKNADEVLDNANSEDTHTRYAEATDSARQLGIFGSPTFVYQGEIFWGDDRLEDAVKWVQDAYSKIP